jgi:putative membrane protein insertion efficiency factor
MPPVPDMAASAPAPGIVGRLLIACLDLFHYGLSPLLGPACRFEPTCSRYAAEAIRTHGPWRGSVLAVRRVGRCHPLHPGGFDPVPRP